MIRGTAAAAAFAAACICGAPALAADIAPMVPAAPPVVIAPAPAPGFDFTGLYAGVTAGGFFNPPIYLDNVRVGGVAGYNFAAGRLIVGVEGAATWEGATDYDVNIAGHAGVVIRGRALLYAVAGYMRALTYPDAWFMLGGGVELGVGKSLSLFAEANYLTGAGGYTLQGGLKFYFGR